MFVGKKDRSSRSASTHQRKSPSQDKAHTPSPKRTPKSKRSKSRSKSKSKSRSKSIDSSAFRSPKRKEKSATPEKEWD